MPGTATIKTKGAYLVRTDGVSGSKNASVIFNNGREFRQLGQGSVKAPAANAYQKRLEHLPALMLAYEIVRSDLSPTYIGQETIASWARISRALGASLPARGRTGRHVHNKLATGRLRGHPDIPHHPKILIPRFV